MPAGTRAQTSKRKRPVVVFVAYTTYGTDPRVRREAEALATHGYDVQVICASPNGKRPQEADGRVQLHQVPLPIRRGGRGRYLYQYLMFFLQSTWLLIGLRLRGPIAVVHVHTLPDFQVFCAIPVVCSGGAVILDLHEALPEILAARLVVRTSSLLYKMAVLAERLSCLFASRVIAANDGIRGAVVSRGLPEDRVTTVYTPAGNVAELEARPGLTQESMDLIVHAGGINQERDLETCIRALSLMQEPSRPMLVMVGDGEPAYVRSLLQLAATLHVSESVKYVGKVEGAEATQWMAKSAVGLVTLRANPLTRIAWPTRIVEYVALDKPLLVPSLDFVSKKLGEGARYYTPSDPESLAREVTRLLARPDETGRMRALARQACADASLQHAIEALLTIYHSVAPS